MSEEENAQLVKLLSKCKPGELSPEVFESIARVAVYSAVEFIPLRYNKGKIQVLLFQRPADDITWPNMLHTPGTILRPTDITFDSAFSRLYQEELIGLKTSEPLSIGYYLSINDRGRCLLLEYILDVKTKNPAVGEFYDIDNLPINLISDQKASIERAVEIFKAMKK